MKYVKQGTDYFVKWDDIVIMDKLDTRKEEDWFYTITTKFRKGYLIGHFAFENGGQKVLEKLEDIEKYVKAREIPTGVKRKILYDVG